MTLEELRNYITNKVPLARQDLINEVILAAWNTYPYWGNFGNYDRAAAANWLGYPVTVDEWGRRLQYDIQPEPEVLNIFGGWEGNWNTIYYPHYRNNIVFYYFANLPITVGLYKEGEGVYGGAIAAVPALTNYIDVRTTIAGWLDEVLVALLFDYADQVDLGSQYAISEYKRNNAYWTKWFNYSTNQYNTYWQGYARPSLTGFLAEELQTIDYNHVSNSIRDFLRDLMFIYKYGGFFQSQVTQTIKDLEAQLTQAKIGAKAYRDQRRDAAINTGLSVANLIVNLQILEEVQ